MALRLGTTNKRLDPMAVERGVEHECPLRPGLTVVLLPAGPFNPRFKRATRERLERLAAMNGEAENAPDHFLDPELVASALVLDMRGIYDEEDREVPYTPDLGRDLLSDPGHADVLEWISLQALDYGRYYTEGVEADAKNSQTGSGGKEAGAGTSETTRS